MDKELKIRVVFDTGKAKAETVEYAEGSIGALEKNLRLAKVAMKDLTVGTAEHTAALVKLKTLQAEVTDAYGRGITATKNATGASANAAMTLQALNYTVRDSPYFFRNFSLGILAVGNNLNPLIDGFMRMKQEAGSTGGAFKVLTGMLTGPQGAIFVFSMLVTILQAVTFAMAKNKAATEENKKSFEDISRAIKEYTATLQDAERSELDLLKKRKENFAAEIEIEKAKLGSKYGVYAWKPDLMGTPEQKAYKAELDALEKRKKAMDDLVTDPLVNDYMQRQTLVFELASIYSGKTLTKIIELNGINKNILNSIVQSAERELNMTDTTNEKYKERKEIFDRLKESYGDLFGKEPKSPKDKLGKEIDGQDESSRQAMWEKLESFKLKLENELQEVVIKNIKDEEDKEIESFKLVIKKKREELEKLWNDLPLAEDKKDFDDAMARLGAEQTEGISGITSKYGSKRLDAMAKANKKAFSDSVDLWIDELKVTEQAMSTAKGFANDLGSALIQAFSSGANAVDSFLRALEAAIVKMLVMLAIQELLTNIFGGVTWKAPTAPAIAGNPASNPANWGTSGNFHIGRPSIIGTSNFPNIGLQRQIQTMNMNMVSGQPTILIQTDIDGLKFTKKTINPAQAKLIRGNVISGS